MTDQPTPQTEARTVLAAALDRAQSQDHTTGMTYWPDVIISVLEDNGLAIEAQARTEAIDVLRHVLSHHLPHDFHCKTADAILAAKADR